MKNKGILILTPFFSPNMGGVETHLDDLVKALDKKGFNIFVLSYSPITTKNVAWKKYERTGTNIKIRRYRWFGKEFFHKVEKFPLIDFLYITPYLFFRSFFWLIFNSNRIDVIHAQGINAAFIGVFLKKIFKKRLIVSTHAIYGISAKSVVGSLFLSILSQSDKILCLSKKSYEELILIGISPPKLDIYRHWVNLERFSPRDKTECRKADNIENKFTVLYVGRLIEKKGIRILCTLAAKMPEINFFFVGTGPEESFLKEQAGKYINIKFFGLISNSEIHKYYNIADILCIPSQYEEGFGRVIMEAVACGLPVVGANKGGIPEALDASVSILVEPQIDNLGREIDALFRDREKYLQLEQNCRNFAERNFSEDNVYSIINYY